MSCFRTVLFACLLILLSPCALKATPRSLSDILASIRYHQPQEIIFIESTSSFDLAMGLENKTNTMNFLRTIIKSNKTQLVILFNAQPHYWNFIRDIQIGPGIQRKTAYSVDLLGTAQLVYEIGRELQSRDQVPLQKIAVMDAAGVAYFQKGIEPRQGLEDRGRNVPSAPMFMDRQMAGSINDDQIFHWEHNFTGETQETIKVATAGAALDTHLMLVEHNESRQAVVNAVVEFIDPSIQVVLVPMGNRNELKVLGPGTGGAQKPENISCQNSML